MEKSGLKLEKWMAAEEVSSRPYLKAHQEEEGKEKDLKEECYLGLQKRARKRNYLKWRGRNQSKTDKDPPWRHRGERQGKNLLVLGC